MRDFEKISFEQFCKDVINDKELYENYKLPSRSSKETAGYDFFLIQDITVNTNEIIKRPTCIKSYVENDDVLLLVVRSSTGFKYNIRLVNQVGVVDSDYYNNKDNEGHIFIKIQNEGKNQVTFKKDEAIAQGIFMKYLTTKSDNRKDIIRKSEY